MTATSDKMEDQVRMERAKRLGYGPQKELIYNSWLPYADQLDDESEKLLQQIRTNFAKAVMLKELKPGCAIWSARLIKYIKLYGLKFSKEYHIELIQLVYELIIIPDIEPTMLHKFCTLLILLTKSEYLISPSELNLPWRPLYETGRNVFSKSSATLGIYHYISRNRDEDDGDAKFKVKIRTTSEIRRMVSFLIKMTLPIADTFVAFNESLESTFGVMVQHLKTYFPPSATREILDDLLPRFLPWHNTNQNVIQDLVLYLPTNVLDEQRKCTIDLWLDKFITLYQVCHNGTTWENDMMILLSNVANSNIGYIDWEPYLPIMFTKFLRSLNLPVNYKQTQNYRQHSIDTGAMTTWIVSVLGPKSSAQKYLNNFITTISTYIHVANQGKWANKLRELLKKFATNFVARVREERYTKKSWEIKTPDSHKLTEEDITKFVECLMEIAMTGMFCRSSEILVVLQNLALLRPSLVITPIIEKLWSTLDSLTEPHKMTSAMQGVIAVARPLASGFSNGFPEGPTHIIPMLFSCLPGLDPNDFKKMAVSQAFISVFANLIPMVDCSGASEYYDDLTEEELAVCEATSQFEDFTLQYIERLFILIDARSMEHTRMETKDDLNRNKEEIGSEHALMMSSIAVLSQVPTKTFKLVLKKLYNFITERILETKVSGVMAASMCKTFSKVNAAETFKLFIPYLCDSINKMISDNEGILKEENLDKELLYHLLILSYIVDKNGVELLPYMSKIYDVIDKGLNFTSKEGYKYICYMLKNIIIGMSNVHPEKCHRSSSCDYDAHVKDFLAIREWGKSGDIWKCDLKWHVPTNVEIECVQQIMNKYLPPELDKLNKYISDELVMTREELNKCLTIVNTLMMANSLMPPSENTPIKLVNSSVQWESFDIICGTTETIHMPDGGNIRQAVSKTMHALQAKLLSSNEDDTKSLCKIIAIWEMLVAKNNSNHAIYDKQWKLLNLVKRSLENKLLGRMSHHKIMLVERALLQHEFRTQAISGPLSVSQAKSMMALLTLATSRYSEVRSCAQARLNWIVANYAYSFEVILPTLVEYMKSDPETEHERLKGTLFCLLGPKQTPIVAKQEWSIVSVLWPAIINSSPSEKPSVIRLMDLIIRSIIMNFPTITMKLKWSDGCIEKARCMLTDADLGDPEFVDLLEKREENVALLENENINNYKKLLDVLIQGANSTKLNWRHSLMCISLLPTVVHMDFPYTPEAVKLVLNCLIHDSILVRKISVKTLVFILKQLKNSHKKIKLNMFEVSGVSSYEENQKLIPGFRPDNRWLQYDFDRIHTIATWDVIPYTNKENFGFYNWPETMMMYAPMKEQEEYTFSVDKFNTTEKIVYDFFMSKDNVDKIINFYSMEDKKGKDKFNLFRFMMYKGLFAKYLDEFLPLFLPHLETLVSDKQESLQRCASEIIAGLIRATKHWPYAKMDNLRIKLTPILKAVFENMTSESFNDWGTCIATGFENMNVSRLSWVLDLLEERMGEDGSSAWVCGRLFLLQAAIIQHPWKLASHSQVLLNIFQSKDMLAHPYQIVRDRIASVLSGLFEKDIVFPNGTQDVAPSIDKLIEDISPQMEMLFKEGMNGKNSSINHSLMPVLGFVGEDNFPSDSGNELVEQPAAIMDKLKFIIQDSITKCGLESNNISITAVNKLIQEVKNVYINDTGKEFENGISSPIESFMSNANILDSNTDENLPFMELLEERLSSALKISELDINNIIALKSSDSAKEDTQNDINTRLFKTVLKSITASIARCPTGIKNCYYVLLPSACTLGSRKGDDELYQLCSAFLSSLADSLHNLESLEHALNSIEKIFKKLSWCSRICCVSFMQSLIFHNMPLMLDGPLISRVKSLTLDIMTDAYPEVREAAASMLSGMLHTGILSDIPQLLKHFKKLCKEKLIKGPKYSESLALKHCGVLGLCAFVAAYPYTVPPYLSDVFSVLGAHLNDPLPIPATIRKTLNDFKRTHHDDWQSHQLKFTEEELALLTDLTVPPSYYA